MVEIPCHSAVVYHTALLLLSDARALNWLALCVTQPGSSAKGSLETLGDLFRRHWETLDRVNNFRPMTATSCNTLEHQAAVPFCKGQLFARGVEKHSNFKVKLGTIPPQPQRIPKATTLKSADNSKAWGNSPLFSRARGGNVPAQSAPQAS